MFVSQKFVSLSSKRSHLYLFLLPKSCVICLVFKTRTAPFINEAEPGGGIRFRDIANVCPEAVERVRSCMLSCFREEKQ